LAALLTGGAVALPLLAKIDFKKKTPELDEIFCRTGLKYTNEDDRSKYAAKLTQAGIDKPSEWFLGLRLTLVAAFIIVCLPKVLVVILMCFFPVAISLLGGLAAVDRDYLELFRTMGASKMAIFRMVKFPLSLPAFFSGLKISASYSVMGAVIGEWLGAKEGIGYYLTLSQRSYMVDRVFAAILAITILSLLIFAVIAAVERLVIPWHRLNEQHQ
jgi:ABC-type proline/glycine betaine transport system permease subunit